MTLIIPMSPQLATKKSAAQDQMNPHPVWLVWGQSLSMPTWPSCMMIPLEKINTLSWARVWTGNITPDHNFSAITAFLAKNCPFCLSQSDPQTILNGSMVWTSLNWFMYKFHVAEPRTEPSIVVWGCSVWCGLVHQFFVQFSSSELNMANTNISRMIWVVQFQ